MELQHRPDDFHQSSVGYNTAAEKFFNQAVNSTPQGADADIQFYQMLLRDKKAKETTHIAKQLSALRIDKLQSTRYYENKEEL